jgi:hemoglobin-like flavoprotein
MIETPSMAREMSAHGLMEDTLLAIGESGIDIVLRFFQRFYAAFPEERARFCNRNSSEGLMVNEMLAMLLAQAAHEPWLATMMRAQVNTHHDHGDIALGQYRQAFAMLLAVLAEAAGPAWTPSAAQAWDDSAADLYALIERFY